MEILYSTDTTLSEDAKRRVDFDVESIRQVVAAERAAEPDVWLAAPEGYQSNGHTLRDSDTIRLVAYSTASRTVYATDGCNACRHRIEISPESVGNGHLAELSARTQLPASLLRRLALILAGRQ